MLENRRKKKANFLAKAKELICFRTPLELIKLKKSGFHNFLFAKGSPRALCAFKDGSVGVNYSFFSLPFLSFLAFLFFLLIFFFFPRLTEFNVDHQGVRSRSTKMGVFGRARALWNNFWYILLILTYKILLEQSWTLLSLSNYNKGTFFKILFL